MTESEDTKKSSGTDFKTMFGPDYEPGDIGHSHGVISAVSEQGDRATIEHGDIHGIGGEPGVSEFEVMDTADLTELEHGTKVEFLVRKGEDDVFRLYLICGLEEGERVCLDDIMDG